MQHSNKREQILDAMQELLRTAKIQMISVSDIAKKAGIGKGSIYYYFSSKNEIIDAVIERSYSRVLEKGKQLASTSHMNAFQKMELIYRACLDSSLELKRQETLATFNELQQSAFIHQKFFSIIITSLKPILADIIRQGIEEGAIHCEYPEETAQIVLTVLTITLDNSLIPANKDQIQRLLTAFTQMQEKGMDIPAHTLQFLLETNEFDDGSQNAPHDTFDDDFPINPPR